MIYKNISAKSGEVVFDTFGGLNRRVRAGGGEFSDMENLSHGEYPCIESMKGAKDMSFDLPEGVEAVKMIIPKRLEGEMTGFSGVAYNGTYYDIYINGKAKGCAIKKFTDAVDFGGSIITLPELKGYNYLSESHVKHFSQEFNMYFYNTYTSTSASSVTPKLYLPGIARYWYEEVFSKEFQVGDNIILSGLTGDFEGNNTLFPKSNLDYSNVTSPVSITITHIDTPLIDGALTVTLTVSLLNSKGEVIGWPKGHGSTTSNVTETTIGHIEKIRPESTYACVAHNRLWVCSHTGEEILASALASPFEFYNLDGLSSDSWVATTGTPGKFTGIAPWHSRVVVFKPDIIHVVYGDLPSTFGIEKTYAAGCIDASSIAEVGGMLMWLYYDGFYAFSGSRPKRISDKLQTKYVSCKAFSDGRRYFARCVKEDGTGEFLIYDSELNIWSKITDIDVVSGDYFGGKVYICDKKKVYCLGEGEYGDFYGETPELTFDSFHDKSIIYAVVRCKIKDGFLNLYTKANNGTWVSHKGIEKTGKHRIPIRYSPGDILRLRLEGRGQVCLTELKLELQIKEV